MKAAAVQMALFESKAKEADVVICNVASQSGEGAHTLITAGIIAQMQVGSVTVDLAAEGGGGNIETTVADDVVVTENGVTCIGYTSLASKMGAQASALYSDNISNFLLSIGPFTGAGLLSAICVLISGLFDHRWLCGRAK